MHAYLKKAVFKAPLVAWKECDPNLKQNVTKAIQEVITGTKWYDADTWTKIVTDELGSRILKGRTIQDRLSEKICRINKPKVLLLISNAPIHEIENRYEQIAKISVGASFGENVTGIASILERIM